MRHRLHRQLRLLQVTSTLSLCGFVVLSAAAFRQASATQKFGEISVERINVVDANGTLRLVIANKDRMHPGVIDGKTLNRPRPVAGLIFFNDEGDEVGGLTYAGQLKDGRRQAEAGIMFDQLKQDQIVGISYREGGAGPSAGLQVWDRPDSPLGDLIEKLNAANAIQDPDKKAAALKSVRESAPAGPRRVFVGKNSDRAATVLLADGQGKPRLVLKVDSAGAASIEFLDADGKVVERLPTPK
jgi:hypothetical protein